MEFVLGAFVFALGVLVGSAMVVAGMNMGTKKYEATSGTMTGPRSAPGPGSI